MALDDAVAMESPRPAPPDRFGSEERFEKLWPGVPRRFRVRCRRIEFVPRRLPGIRKSGDAAAPVPGCVAGVLDQIHDHLLQLSGVSLAGEVGRASTSAEKRAGALWTTQRTERSTTSLRFTRSGVDLSRAEKRLRASTMSRVRSAPSIIPPIRGEVADDAVDAQLFP